jgi:hypothetical protein
VTKTVAGSHTLAPGIENARFRLIKNKKKIRTDIFGLCSYNIV